MRRSRKNPKTTGDRYNARIDRPFKPTADSVLDTITADAQYGNPTTFTKASAGMKSALAQLVAAGKIVEVAPNTYELAAEGSRQYVIKIGMTAGFALNLDDVVMLPEIKREQTGAGWVVTGPKDDVALVLDDLEDRGLPKRVGQWDQPDNWMYACRNAGKSVRRQLEAQGLILPTHRS